MQGNRLLHGSCAAKCGEAVLVMGPPSSGKSDLVLRLLARGFDLVADDQVSIANGIASAPPALAGLLEVRGIGIVRLPYTTARLALVVELGAEAVRLPPLTCHPELDVPLILLDPLAPSAPDRVILALDCAAGRVPQVAGVFAG